MRRLSDEILNKYIDGDLTSFEMKEVKEILKSSEEDRRNLKALQLVHQNLKNTSGFETSVNFTSKVMAGLKGRVKARKEDKYFIYSISSIFIVISLGVIGFVLYNIIHTINTAPQGQQDVNTYVNYVITFFHNVSSIFNTNSIPVFGSIISFGVIISAYLFYENLRHAKRRLSRQN